MAFTSLLEAVLQYSPSETQSPSGRTLIFSYLSTYSLLSLRCCSRTLNTITSLYTLNAFRHLQLIFKAAPSSLHHCRLKPHRCSLSTPNHNHNHNHIPLTLHLPNPPPLLPEDPEYIFSFHLPRDGCWDESGHCHLEEDVKLIVAEGEAQGLWGEAPRVAGWARVFRCLPGLRRVETVARMMPAGLGS